MPHSLRLWKVSTTDSLEEVPAARLDLEARLEKWLDRDHALLGETLLEIGRQVETSMGSFIDLLFLDREGNGVVVELKRDRTPRDVVAQALEYAAWVRALSHDDIVELANAYLVKRPVNPENLEAAFQRAFGAELPEVLNEEPRILIVGSEIDARSESIIEYLSSVYGVPINAVQFQYLRQGSGPEFIARTFLIQPEEVGGGGHSTGRAANLKPSELLARAETAGVGEVYRKLSAVLGTAFSKRTTRSSLTFCASLEGGSKAVFNLVPGGSEAGQGLRYQAYIRRLARALGTKEGDVQAALPPGAEPWTFLSQEDPDYTGVAGFFRSEAEIDRLENLIRAGKGA